MPKKKKINKTGLILVFTGNGKGKTTAAIGTAVRAAGHGMKSIIIQFIKGTISTGEIKALNRYGRNIKIIPMGRGFIRKHTGMCPISNRMIKAKRSKELIPHLKMIEKAWDFSKKSILNGKYDLVILDEINYAIDYGFLNAKEVARVLKKKPKDTHIILTGRNADKILVKCADLLTEMKEIKHHFNDGIKAVKGIEF